MFSERGQFLNFFEFGERISSQLRLTRLPQVSDMYYHGPERAFNAFINRETPSIIIYIPFCRFFVAHFGAILHFEALLGLLLTFFLMLEPTHLVHGIALLTGYHGNMLSKTDSYHASRNSVDKFFEWTKKGLLPCAGLHVLSFRHLPA